LKEKSQGVQSDNRKKKKGEKKKEASRGKDPERGLIVSKTLKKGKPLIQQK